MGYISHHFLLLLWCGRIVCILSIIFNKTLIGQADSIGGKARQEVGVEQRDWEYSGSRAPSATPVQTTEEATCKLSQ